MISVEQAIIVEGKYDKIKLSSIVDAVIIVTDGFSLFKDKEKREMIRFFAKKKGIIILTDSDSAGFKIRNHIKSFVNEGEIINVYIPDIFGKERRKEKPSKEGKLGVEGMSSDILINAFEKAGIFKTETYDKRKITKLDLYEDGLFGTANSSEKRKILIFRLGLPELLTPNSLIDVLNALLTFDEYKKMTSELNI